MKGTIRATVKVKGLPQVERRFVKGTKAHVIADWKTHTRSMLLKKAPATTLPRSKASGTLAADADRYLIMVKHLASWRTRRAEIRHWLPHIGSNYRHVLTREHILRVRCIWVQAGVAAKTVNNRVTALRDLYHKLDGDEAATPCDRVKPLLPPRIPIQVVSPDQIHAVCAALLERSRKTNARHRPAHMHALKDRARLMVLASSGRRPCEVGRTRPEDIDWRRRVWGVRDAKGGWTAGLYLNDDMLAAWQEFDRVHAYGHIDDQFGRRLRAAGWPATVRPYNMRHSTWIEASERGFDLADIQAGAGHRNIRTTRQHYVPVLNSRMEKLSKGLDGRFGWVPRIVKQETA
jgi:integrase